MHPGPDPAISEQDIKAGRMVSRRYRNRRIGEFLKELEFTEGRGTGVPKIRRSLKNNGSPKRSFFTDGARQSFWIEIQIHPEFLKDHRPSEARVKAHVEAQVEAQVEALVRITEVELKILNLCLKTPIGNKDIIQELGYKTLSGNVKKALQRLRENGAIAYTVPTKPRSQHQQYTLTEKGKRILRAREIV